MAKIIESNAASIALFSRKLGFTQAKRVAAFEEVHLVSRPVAAGDGDAPCAGAYREERVRHGYAGCDDGDLVDAGAGAHAILHSGLR